MGIIGIIQLLVASIALISAVLLFIKIGTVTSSSRQFFTTGLIFLGLWSGFHFVGNLFNNLFFYKLGATIGFLFVLAITYAVTYLQYSETFNLKNVFSTVFFTLIVTYQWTDATAILGLVPASGDIVILYVDPLFEFLQSTYLLINGIFYLEVFYRISKKAYGTRHYKYALFLFFTGVLGYFGTSATTIIREFLLTTNEILFVFRNISLYIFPLIWVLSILYVIFLDFAVFWILPYSLYQLIVFDRAGKTVFSHQFRKLSNVDIHMVSSGIKGAISLFSELMATGEDITGILFEDRVISIYKKGKLFFAIIADKRTKTIEKSLKNFGDLFTKNIHYFVTSNKVHQISPEKIEKGKQLVKKFFPLTLD